MMDESGPKPKPEISFDEAVNVALSGSGIGDTSNNYLGLKMSLANPDDWRDVIHVRTYEEYIRHKYENRPDLAAAIVKRSDKEFVVNYDAAMRRINEAIGTGIQNEEQAQRVRSLCDEARKIVADFCKTLS